MLTLVSAELLQIFTLLKYSCLSWVWRMVTMPTSGTMEASNMEWPFWEIFLHDLHKDYWNTVSLYFENQVVMPDIVKRIHDVHQCYSRCFRQICSIWVFVILDSFDGQLIEKITRSFITTCLTDTGALVNVLDLVGFSRAEWISARCTMLIHFSSESKRNLNNGIADDIKR